MNLRKLVGNFSVAVLAQGVAFLLNLLITLVMPKVLGITEFSYWQLFIFYSSYVGFFHFGINDGVYLVEGGKDRNVIEKKSVFSQFIFSAVTQTVLALGIIAVALISPMNDERLFVVIATSIYMIINNLALYLGYVFQAMNETKLFSYSMILDRLVFLIPLLILLFSRYTYFEPYVIFTVAAALVRLLFCLWFSRDFLTAGLEKIRSIIQISFKSISIGVKLMLANIASMLILGVARFIIDAVWGIQTFGKLSLSLSMVTFFLSFVTQASMVLFPALRQSGEAQVSRFYTIARDLLGVLFPLVYVLYFPLVWILGLWLPDYKDSLIYFAFLLPICVFDSKMNITSTTLFKVRRNETTLLRINLVTVCFSIIGSLIGGYLLHSVYFIIAIMVIAIAGRSIFSEWYLTRAFRAPKTKIVYGEVVLTLAFIALATFTSTPIAIVSYLGLYGIFIALFKGTLKTLHRGLKSSLSHTRG